MAGPEHRGPDGGLLVVDDVADLRMLIKLMLSVDPRLLPQHEAATAEDALHVLDDNRPALIILDNELQGSSMSGLEAAAKLKAQAPDAKILLFSAYDLHRAADAEPAIDEFLRKDQIGELLDVARRLLGLSAFDPG